MGPYVLRETLVMHVVYSLLNADSYVVLKVVQEEYNNVSRPEPIGIFKYFSVRN